MARAAALEGISYASLAEFVRDALRRRVEAINEAWRESRAAYSVVRAPPGQPPGKRDGKR